MIFAAMAAFFLAALISDQVLEYNQPLWTVLAVPLLAVGVFYYTWYHPERPAAFENILSRPPNRSAGILPVEYYSVGVAAAIFGVWTSRHMRHSKTNE